MPTVADPSRLDHRGAVADPAAAASAPRAGRTPAPILSGGFARAYLVTMRPYLCFVSGAAGLVGLALAPALAWPAFAAAFAALFLTYGLGQALTDVFQTDTDALSSPYRPLTHGAIAQRDVLVVSLAGLGACGVVLGLMNPWSLPLSALGVAGLASYSFFKRRWWAGPAWNSWVVALLPAIGLLCGGGALAALPASPTLGPAASSVFFSYAIFVLLGYLKDVSADRATGYRTLPVVAGPGAAIAVSGGFAIAALASSLLLLDRLAVAARLRDAVPGAAALAPLAVAALLWLGGALAVVAAHPLALRYRAEHASHRAIVWTVRGFVWLHTGEAALARPALALPGLAFCLLAEWALRVRPERSQI
jgi:4-hydroxybenzoate polyprenyltransferase